MRNVFSIILGFILLCAFEPSSYAYHERPYEAPVLTGEDLSGWFDSQDDSYSNRFSPLVPEPAVHAALNDQDHRISPEFRIPPELRAQVEFWFRIYTQYTTEHLVLFDEHHPEVIYDVLDFRDLATRAKNKVVYEILREREIRSTIAEYRKTFRRLARGIFKATPVERKILAALRRSKQRIKLSSLSQSFHTQTGQRDNIVSGLALADEHFPKMEAIFSALGLPPQLTRLVLVESSFNSEVISRAGATGIWQFMERSAREYLLVNDRTGIDERLSPLKSTVAAARLLQRNYRIFRDWGLTITSYNSGIRPMLPSARYGSNRLLSENNNLGFAGKSYFPSFLAILHAEAYRELFYGRTKAFPATNVRYVRLDRPETLFGFGIKNSYSSETLVKINPDIKSAKSRLPVGLWIAVPSDQTSDFTGLVAANWIQKRKKEKKRFARQISLNERR